MALVPQRQKKSAVKKMDKEGREAYPDEEQKLSPAGEQAGAVGVS